jgi:hypothetical protein
MARMLGRPGAFGRCRSVVESIDLSRGRGRTVGLSWSACSRADAAEASGREVSLGRPSVGGARRLQEMR